MCRLKFAKTCKTIKNVARNNRRVLDDKTLLKQYKLRILDLKQQVHGRELCSDKALHTLTHTNPHHTHTRR